MTHIVPLQNYKLLHALDLWLTCSIYEISNVKSVSTKASMFLTAVPFVGYSEIDKFRPLLLKSLPITAPKPLLEICGKGILYRFLNSHLELLLLDNDDLIQIFESHPNPPNGHT